MKERLKGKTGTIALLALALLTAITLGAVLAVTGSDGQVSAQGSTSTTGAAGVAGSTTTTANPGSGAHPNQPDPGDIGADPPSTSSTTTATTRPTGSGGTPSTTEPQNAIPVLLDPGISSDGLHLTVAPIAVDPDSPGLEVTVTIDGESTTGAVGTPVAKTFDLAEVGYAHVAEVVIEVSDDAGNTVSETFSHAVEAITTLVVKEVKLRVQTPPACFSDDAAVRVAGNVAVQAATTQGVEVDEELRADRTEVVLISEITDSVVGTAAALGVSFDGTVLGTDDSHSRSFTQDDQVLDQMFVNSGCTLLFTYKVEVEIR